MDVAISCLARNKLVNIDNLFCEANPLKHVLNDLVLTKSFFHSWNFCIKSNRYLTDLLVNNQLIRRLFSGNPIIPEDVIRLEILPRLPSKSLLRFQCVCKSWHSLILSRDPIFLKSHLASTSVDPTNDWLLVRAKPGHHPSIEILPNKSKHPLQSWDMALAGSVNGLVCVYRCHRSSKSVPLIGIWNPATHHYKDVPPPSTASHVEVSDFFFAFGFDSVKNDYKVIYITQKNKGSSMQLVADVYSCNTDSWGNINVSSSFLLERGGTHSKRMININEIVYWIYCKEEKNPIISFDTTDEVFRLLPDLDDRGSLDDWSSPRRALVNLRNYLTYLVHEWDETTNVDVYILNETMPRDGGTWSKMYTIGPITGLTNYMYIFQCFKNGDLFFKNDRQCKLVSLDPETHAVLGSSIHTFDSTHCLSCAYGVGYTETLVSVKGMKHIDTQTNAVFFYSYKHKISP